MVGGRVDERIICAGFGGQGIMVMGKVLAEAAMLSGFNVTWMPAYGAEVRGGTAYAMVRFSDSLVANPVVEKAGTAIIMNGPSMEKFISSVEPGGLAVVNTSLVAGEIKKRGLDIQAHPITEEAIKLGNVKVANMIAAGIYAARKKLLDPGVLRETIKIMAGEREEIIPVNIKALERGLELGCGKTLASREGKK
ncbi:MAG TPA: 2-oxoacid:acceptor oxidoreductase family protein [Candidatus Omnitrophota bacterium]|nr:2-oxoacid:acceptor oxidoreductase family protein [Candidatus Omnitrophota bacterium]